MADAALKAKRKTRGGHRAYVSKVLAEAKGLIGTPCTASTKPRIVQLKAALEEQLANLRKLDEEILQELVGLESATDDEIADEVEAAGNLKGDIRASIASLEDLLAPKPEGTTNPQQNQPIASGSSTSPAATSQPNVRVRFPKLEVKHFTGRIEEWQEFWDCYESAIHTNVSLSAVDKFSYLRGLLGGAARTAIAGLALTNANYDVAINLLKNRFGKATAIERAHVNELLNVSPVAQDKDTSGLRKLYDTVEIHHRGLEALKVDANTYEGIVVPAVISKLPEGVRLQITRGKNHTEWKMQDLLTELLNELELREEHCTVPRSDRIPLDNQSRGRIGGGPNSASALLAKTLNDFCAYCRGAHAHQDCTVVKSVDERKQLLRKYGRCFVCAKKGLLARDCKSKFTSSVCKGKHHVSICDGGNVTNLDSLGRAQNCGFPGSPRSNDAGNASYGQPMGPGGNRASQTTQASPALHVGSVGRVALQTAQAVVKGCNKNVRVRVLFDAGSHRSFITKNAVQSAGLSVERQEWVEISTFGQGMKDSGLRDVYQIEVFPVPGGQGVKIEVYGVPSIAQIRNEHVEIEKCKFPYLQGLWFSDVNREMDVLEIDLLIGADFLWCFQKGRTIKGEAGEPVAIETNLGWVLSGPLRGSDDGSQVSVNLISHGLSRYDGELEDSIRKLWNYET